MVVKWMAYRKVPKRIKQNLTLGIVVTRNDFIEGNGRQKFMQVLVLFVGHTKKRLLEQ